MSGRRIRRRHGRRPMVVSANAASLLDMLDNLLDKGVMVTGDLVLGIAGVDLLYLRVSALLCPVDRALPPEEPEE